MLRPQVFEIFREVDHILHGGDICGPFTGASANFGKSVPTSSDDHDVDYGWHHRPKNWEFFTDVQ